MRIDRAALPGHELVSAAQQGVDDLHVHAVERLDSSVLGGEAVALEEDLATTVVNEDAGSEAVSSDQQDCGEHAAQYLDAVAAFVNVALLDDETVHSQLVVPELDADARTRANLAEAAA